MMRWPWSRSDRVSCAWLREQDRLEVSRSAEFEGVCWSRPFDRRRDYNGRLTRWIERTRAIESRRKEA